MSGGWFGLMEEKTKRCPFCGNGNLKITREMMRPWGFAPRNAESIPDVQLSEEYTAVQQPLYSTLPEAEEMKLAPGCNVLSCLTKDRMTKALWSARTVERLCQVMIFLF